MRTQILLFSVLMACSTGTDDSSDSTPSGTTTVPAENPYGEPKNCPVIETGTISTKAGGVDRMLEIELPANPQGAPVVFAWHWLGGNATEILDWMNIRDLADAGYIVVAPEADGSQPFEWNTFDDTSDNADFALLDKMLPCLSDQFNIDDKAVFATGHSAGGLMTSFLTMHRSDVLAATAPFSGGTDSWSYDSPAQPIPVLVTWGGVSDTYGGYSFQDASQTLMDLLTDDGSSVYACDHGGGHIWPDETPDMLVQFFDDHRLGEESPWKNGLPSGMPSFCSL